MEAKMTIKAKPILKNKFWIVEKDGERIGTLSKQEDKRYMYSCSTGTDYFTDIKSFNSFIGGISYDKSTISDGSPVTKEIHGFSTSSAPYNVMYNCLLYTSPSPRDGLLSRMPSSA